MPGDCCCEQPRECDVLSSCCKKEDAKLPSATTPQFGHEKAREVRIFQLDLGYTVSVGCQTFAIQNLKTVIKLLSAYLDKPEETEKKWREGKLKFE